MGSPAAADNNALHDLGYKIFLDRYALKDMTRKTLAVGDTVIVVVDSKTGQREVGNVTAFDLPTVTIKLLDGETVTRDLEHVDKPLETRPEQMMSRVAAGIAHVEPTPEAQAEWSEKFRWLLDGWKFVPGGRILAGAGTDQQLTYYNCMPPEQEILTAEGYRPLGDVQVGDLVVTHRNRLRRVLHRFERETEEPLYIVKTRKLGFDNLRLTGEHKVLAIRSEWVNKHRSRDGLRLAQEPQWIPAKELRPGDFLAAAHDGEITATDTLHVFDYVGREDFEGRPAVGAYALNDGWVGKSRVRPDGTKMTGKPTLAVRDALVIDAELMELFGRWLGDGCVTHRTGTDIPSGIKIVFGLDEEAEAEHIARIVEDKLGVPAAIKLSSTKRWLDLWVNAMPIGEFFANLFGKYSYGKRIPAELMRQPDHLVKALLRGLFQADGYTSHTNIGMALSNRTLATQVHQLLLRLGYFFAIFENTHKLGRVPAYRISSAVSEAGELFETFFDRPAPLLSMSQRTHIEYDSLKWARIEEIETETYTGTVLDIEVEEDHSFVSAGVVVSNCYVIASPRDSRGGIMETLGQMTEIMSRGGGVGINISTLRPRHAYVKGVNGRSSGAVSWGALYSFVTGLIEQGGSRRGALMLILNDWHPDVFTFINSKRQAGQITNANISVGVSDKLMDAVKADGSWDLMFPDTSDPEYDTVWNGDLDKWIADGHKAHVYKTVKACEVWDAIIESAWASAEPGVWFRERSNKMANSWYFNPLISTNPCGEQPLGAFSVCNLGAINLAKLYDAENHDVAWDDLANTVRYAVRFLDDVIDSTPYFFEENARVQGMERRVGLGTMGIAELMIRLKVRYGSAESEDFIDRLYKFIAVNAYDESVEIAKVKGPFSAFDPDKFLQSGFIKTLPDDLREKIRAHGVRNVTLLTQAPTGTTGTLVNTSTGIEPFFSWVYYRKSRLGLHEEHVPIVQEWLDANPGKTEKDLPDYFATAMDLTPEEHVRVQAAFQRWIDSAISKTCNVPNEYTVEQVSELYMLMYDLGCKGGTIYRDGSRSEQVLMLKGDERAESEMKDKEKALKAEAASAEPAPAPVAVSSEPVAQPVATPHRVYPRPAKLFGVTVKVATPFGTAYVNMNVDENSNPFEVFVTAPGKAGSDLQADAEGLGRLITLSLRSTPPHNRREMLRLIIEQLRDIGGSRTAGFGPNRVMSLPDAVARALEDHFFHVSTPAQLSLPLGDAPAVAPLAAPSALPLIMPDGDSELEPDAAPVLEFEMSAEGAQPKGFVNGHRVMGADMCPSCHTISLVRAEGCRKCLTCGYSEC